MNKTIETLKEIVACLTPHDHSDIETKLSALIEQMEKQEPVGEIIEAPCFIGFGRSEIRKTVQFDMKMPVGTKLYTTPQQCSRCAEPHPMDEAIAAGNGTLHGAIDYWQNRCKKLEELLRAKRG